MDYVLNYGAWHIPLHNGLGQVRLTVSQMDFSSRSHASLIEKCKILDISQEKNFGLVDL